MKLPNGFGNVSKLSGKRRKPWRARKTVGWSDDGTQKYLTIGYYEKQAQALQALAEYNANPYTISGSTTFADIYERWSAEKYETISRSNVNGYKAAYAVCTPLYDMKFPDIKKSHLQGVVDNSGKNYPTLRKLKVLLNQLFRYALENDICAKDYSEFIDIVKHKGKKGRAKHKIFTGTEINRLWECHKANEYITIILMLIYSGVRISEMLNLKKADVHLAERYFDVIESKTDAGVRQVPIASRVLPFFTHWMTREGCDTLLCSAEGAPFKYRNYYDSYWLPLMEKFSLDHLPHDTRHTTISLLAKANINQTIIKRIVGHSGAMNLTEKVYTHFDVQQLLDAIDLI